MEIRDKIIHQYTHEFSSCSKDELPSEENIEFIIQKECKCDKCEIDLKYQTCPCCENSFELVTKPEDHRFILSVANIKEFRLELKAGIYQVLEYPFFYGNCVTGFDGIFDGSIKLIKEIDIDKIMRFNYGKGTERISADEICDECFDLYSGKSYIKNSYCDKVFGLHHNITLRGLIKS
jgi:hypothetical protein